MDDDVVRIAMTLPEYIVEGELGRGGMGVVYVGRHRRLDRPVAIKELPPAFAVDEDVRDRFGTEARTLASLSHPHIVPIFDYVEREGLCLIVMEQLPGGTLWDRFTSTGVTTPAACALVMAACAALEHAHSRGVLHLDVKPDNLMFDADGLLKVTDFGISSAIGGGRTLGTVDGTVLGTPAYMAPEQAQGAELTPATDTYAAGVMLYELLSGQLPWTGAESAAELLRQRVESTPIPLLEVAPRVPPPIAEVAMTALSLNREERFGTAEAFGVAVGYAAAESWGADWTDHAGVAILGSQAIAAAARVAPAGAVALGGIDTAAGETEIAPPSLSFVRGGAGARLEGLDLNRLGRGDLVDVDDLLHPPERPRRAIVLTVALAALALIVAIIGLGQSSRSGPLHGGQVLVAGNDVATESVSADLGHSVVVRIPDVDQSDAVDEVVLRLSTLGVPLGEARAPAFQGRAAIDPGKMRLIAAGDVTGEVELRSGGEIVVTQEFAFTAENSWYLTAMGIGSLLILLIAIANLESSVKPLLRGRSRRRSLIGAVVWSTLIGVGTVTLVAALSIAEMTILTLVVVGALSAGAGLAGYHAAVGIGRRRRLQQAMKRAARTARKRATV